MKTKLIPLFLLLLTSVASADDSRVLGDWATGCTPDSAGSVMQQATFSKDGIAVNTAQIFASTDCTGAVIQTKTYKATYTVIATETPSKVLINLTADPSSIFEGDLVWVMYEVNFLSDTSISAKITDLVIQNHGTPVSMPAEAVAQLPVEIWTKK